MSKNEVTYIQNILEQVSDIPENAIISRTIYRDDETKVILFAFATGQELSEHTSPQKATLHFLQGEAEVTLGEETKVAQTGTWVIMPPHLPHSIVAKSDVLMLLTMTKT